MRNHTNAVSGEALANFDAGELLDLVYGHLQASNAITSGGVDGLISSLDYHRLGEKADGVGPFSPGTDRMRALDIRATFANEQPMARKNLGNDQPRKLFALVEYGNRYNAATGNASLRGLSRLALAVTCIAAEKAHVSMDAIFVSDGMKSLLVEGKPADAVWTLDNFDEFIKEADATKQVKNGASALTEGLYELSEFGARTASDVAIVVSDFVGDAQFSGKPKKLDGFGWEAPLQEMQHRLEDRLYTVRLTTPAQTELPYGHDFEFGGRGIGLDVDEYLQMSKIYERVGTIKQNRLAKIFRDHRVLELDSTDRTPFISVADFVFGSPEKQ